MPTCDYWTNHADGGGLCSSDAVAIIEQNERDWSFACPEHAAICEQQAREHGWTIKQLVPRASGEAGAS